LLFRNSGGHLCDFNGIAALLESAKMALRGLPKADLCASIAAETYHRCEKV
jgi:hypothetical protein